MSFFDIQDAYFLIPVEKINRKFLRFIFKNHIYQFTCLPFGLCTSPFVFTKVMKPVINPLTIRSKYLLSVAYLNDFLLMGRTL